MTVEEMIKQEQRVLVDYYELSTEWQEVARSNTDNYEDILFIEPLPHHIPNQHVLLDIEECMKCGPDSLFDGVIGVSNNSAIGLSFIDGSDRDILLTYL